MIGEKENAAVETKTQNQTSEAVLAEKVQES